ncbi:hypothetical protein Tco_0974134 [Tanacetum coccineum]|uniref:Uncharacterized protein n=1 Tax=Tanacetum coccineum TaxID=301880 RepID=A0ABQ5EAR2_9ASTR
MSEPMPSIPTQSPFTYPIPNPSALPSFTQDDTSESFISEPTQTMPRFTQTAFSQPVLNLLRPTRLVSSTLKTLTMSSHNSFNSSKQPLSLPMQNFFSREGKYEIWAMKMEYWIQNADHNLWRIVQQGNSPKRLGKDAKGNTIVHPPVSLDEHVAVQRENKARPDNDDINLKFLRALPSSWSQVALHLKYKSYGRESAAAPTHSAFIGAASSAQSYLFLISKVFCSIVYQISSGDGEFGCNVKSVDDKARYSAFKVTEVKTDEPKALVSVDSCVGVFDAEMWFALMGISPKAYQNAVKTLESQKDWYHKTQIALEEKMMQVGSNPALARELLGADVTEANFVERMTAIKEKKKRALADLRYRALKGKPMQQSEVTQMMRNLVKNQWCAAHNGTITMKAVKAMSKQQLIEEYEYICRRLEKDRLLSAQYNLFRPKPVISEPPSKRQRVDRDTSQPSGVPAASTQHADDPDSAGGGSFQPAGSAPPMAGFAVPDTAGGTLGTNVTASTVPTSAAMDSAGSHRESGVSPFADSADSSSPSPVSTDHIPIDVLFEPTSGGINEFFLDSDEDEQIGMSRVAADPDSDDEVLAEILFRGQYISGAGVVVVDKLPDDEIVDPRVKVETVSDYASSPPRTRRKHRGVRSDDCLWDKPVEDFFSSESESDDDMENYIPPLPYGAFKDWEIVRCPLSTTYYHVYYQENRRQKSFFYLKQLLPHVYREDLLLLRRRMNRYFRLNPDVDVGLDLWRDVNLLCQSLHSDDVEDFWRTQDEWVVSSWKLYPKSSVHVLDLTNGKTVYMFVDKVYPIRATLLERMLRHRLTVPPSYCRDVVVAGNVIQTVQAGLRESYECLASVPIACTARQMVFSSPWLTAKKESGSPLQTALVCNSNPLMVARLPKPGCCCKDWKLLFFNVAACFVAAGYLVSAGTCFCCYSILLLREDLSRNLELTESKPIVPADSSSSIPADYVSAGHVLVSADRDRIC